MKNLTSFFIFQQNIDFEKKKLLKRLLKKTFIKFIVSVIDRKENNPITTCEAMSDLQGLRSFNVGIIDIKKISIKGKAKQPLR